ncbi:C40 family peptidase [Corynebacterium aquatimens]|nr:C40 family peptidase [Corynebacterium aquatimens]
MMKQMEELSHTATAKSEEIKELEGKIGDAKSQIAKLNKEAKAAQKDAALALGRRDDYQVDVDRIAQTRYRNTQNDAVIASFDSGNPQEVIDRAAYLGSISRSSERTLDGLQKTTREAANRATDADMALAVANYRTVELEANRDRLKREQKDLDKRIAALEERVDSLSPEQRARWERKNGPVDGARIPPSAHGNAAVSAAMSKLGSPYGWGATGPNEFDCSGLMVWAYAQQGKTIPRTSQAQLSGGTPVSLNDLQPGDIIGYYPGVTHVGMYIGDGKLVHASDYGIPVQVVPYDSMPIQGAVRF